MYMCISLIIVSVLYVGIAESINCYNCVGTSNDAQAGQTSTGNCHVNDSTGGPTCTGDFCFVTTLNYDDSIASPITIVWRQCGKSASLPQGVNTGQCEKNNAAFKQTLYVDRNLCCYKLEYSQPPMLSRYRSNVTYCFCTDEKCNDLQYRTNFTFSDSNPTQAPGISSIMPSVANPTQAPGVSSAMPPVAAATTDLKLSGILVSVYVIPIASTAVVSVLMILSAVCLWKMS